MFKLPEQFSTATKANFDAQLAILSAFTSKALEGVEKVVELNLAVAKSSIEESNAAVKQLIKDPQDYLNSAAAQAQPNAEKVLAYTRLLTSIISGVQADLTKTTEAHVAETNRKVVALVEEISKHAPAGSEHAVALLKSTIGNANASYEQLNKSTKQGVEAFEAAVSQLSQATPNVASRSSKKG